MNFMRLVRYFVAVVTFFAISGTVAVSQAANEKMILVLDASGSMWGQIDGVNKIVIAKQAVNDLLDTLPASQSIGLSAYGHREKGSCSDIELLVPPAPNSGDAIRAAVQAISPKGKTPLSAAVLAAAKELRFEEDPATVILISDGRETCDLDPCAIGAELEATGVGFTAHVIGFDVTEAEDRAQLACLAEETGGRFLSASNAVELVAALEEVAEVRPEPPAQADILLEATDGPDGPLIGSGLVWWLVPSAEDGTKLDNFEIGAVRMTAKPGAYTIRVAQPATADTTEMQVEVLAGTDNHFVLAIGAGQPEATLEAPATAVAGSTVLVNWEGPAGDGDMILVVEPERESGYVNYTYTHEGSPLELVMPPKPGTYEIRYHLVARDKSIAAISIDVTPVTAELIAPESAEIGATVLVEWNGPDYANDFVSVTSPDAEGRDYINYTYTREGKPLVLQMPGEPGVYELRYIMYQGDTVLATKAIEVKKAEVSLDAPDTAALGSEIVVAWVGPNAQGDYISVAKLDARGNQYENYTYTRDGSPLKVRMPSAVGDYEIRYVLNQDSQVLASRKITIEDVEVSLSAPDRAALGSEILVEWVGPNEQSDYISVAKLDGSGNQYENYTYTRDGSPLKLKMPSAVGDYEIRYVLNQNSTVLARRPISIEDVQVFIDAPATATVGSSIVVDWVGPDAQGDYISVAKLDAQGNQYENYSYTRDGTPLKLAMPATPGDYEIRYILSQDSKILERSAIKVEPAQVSVTAPASAAVGSKVVVEWTGPNAQSDYISVAAIGASGNQYENYTYTRDGAPLTLTMPAKPGEYEIRYILSQGSTVLATQAISVTAVQASVSVPATAAAGSTIIVTWEGPGYDRDYLTIVPVGAEASVYTDYKYAPEGSPLTLKTPIEPGAYEVRYVLDQDTQVLAKADITLTAVTASLTAPAEAVPGSTIIVEWEGPGYERDFITVVAVGSPDGAYNDYEYAPKGSPLTLTVPETPGAYEIRYVNEGSSKVLARRPLTLK